MRKLTFNTYLEKVNNLEEDIPKNIHEAYLYLIEKFPESEIEVSAETETSYITNLAFISITQQSVRFKVYSRTPSKNNKIIEMLVSSMKKIGKYIWEYEDPNFGNISIKLTVNS